jgi:hypothetical protein
MKSINPKAPVKCSQLIEINAGIEKVWAVMTRIDQWESWQTDISKVRLMGELKAGTTFEWKTGGAKIQSILHTVEPFKYFGWTGKTYGMFAIHNWTIEVKNGQTIVRVDESMEGLIARLFKNAFNKNLQRDMRHWLELLKAECEKDKNLKS